MRNWVNCRSMGSEDLLIVYESFNKNQLNPNMSKPESIKIEPWGDFPRQGYSIITDDFVHEKLAVVKVNAKGEKSTANLKATLSQSDKGVSLSDETKIWFSLANNRAIYTKLKGNNLRLHFDNGTTEAFSKKWNLYASLNTSKELQNLSLRLGAINLAEHCHSDNRLKLDFTPSGNSATWYNRTIVKQDKLTLGLLGALGLTSRTLVKNNLLLGYQLNDQHALFARVENDGYRATGFNWAEWAAYFDTFKLDWTYNHDASLKAAAEVSVKTRGTHAAEGLLVLQHYQDSQKLTTKVRLSTKLDASLVFKLPCPIFKDIGTLSLGFHGSQLASEKRAFKYGGQLEFNV